ncbi:hypothetical protein GCM10011369_11940 [Neiella marina]|uniref:DUF3313 domain-containing protein n=1 Tax=Neiella marina TaxID=508461 RepID=A0A8J2XLR9_9GAMM|nr:DUF3313 family protein [Neiella marina]GGA71764.1 hypothetical protein GCM10011369_11940 [Neiella marina]
MKRILATCCLCFCLTSIQTHASNSATGADQLTEIETETVDQLYVNPNADFSHYNNLALAVTEVEFRERSYRSWFNSRAQMKRAMDNAIPQIQHSFDEAFRKVINEQGDFQLVEHLDEKTLVIVPRLVNVYLNNLDEMAHATPTRVYSESAGHMTLVLDLYDSVSGEMLARVIDHQQATEWGRFVRQSSVDNNRQVKRLATNWATDLNQGLSQSRQQ